MNLRKQLFTSFLMLAMLPLAAVGIYIFATNLILAFDLHEQNLRDSTQIQAELVEENINRLMVRARKFVSSQEVKRVCGDNSHRGEGTISELSDDILNFTDETLDNVAIFALLDLEGEIIYSSGSVSDSRVLKANLPTLSQLEQQLVSEIPFTDPGNSLVIYTPVQENKTAVGTLVIVCRTDYFFKLISSHRQLESSNALIYCREHHQIITSKQDVSGSLSELDLKVGEESRGGLLCKMNDQYNLAYYQSLLKTPWVLVSTVDTAQIFSKVKNYGLINIAALLTVFFIIIILSRNQSRKMLYPLDQLLGAVEEFFLNGATKFPEADIDPKTEIGYLAEKFSNLSDEMTLVQDKIRESNYLYAALLMATYEFRIVIDFQADTVECSSGRLSARIDDMQGRTASERVLALFSEEGQDISPDTVLYRIVCGKLTEPMETETCFSIKENEIRKWYRVVAVPVIQGTAVWRAALHFEDITDKKLEELRLIQSSQTDPLCGLYNKTAFPLHCKLSREGRQDAVFFIDLDKFKQVNDTLGHAAGDEALISTAQAIRAQFRECDVVGRFGGDEFVVFAPCIGREMAEQKAERLVQAVSFLLDAPPDGQIHLTASVGVYMVTPPETLDDAVRRADEAMYRAKEKGRSQYCIM